MPDSFEKQFEILTGNKPFPWQQALSEETTCRNKVIRIPTGLGKTQGVIAAWSYQRIIRKNEHWPRRLIWCLPMRVLVEQIEHVAKNFVSLIPLNQRPEVHVAMGGEDAGEWFLFPEKNAIIIGTQDMLLSRALNRGYGSGRARWPVEFGLLNQDSLWIMDEVQLMDVGLATSAQLQAYREQDQSKQLRPCRTWWMSATLQTDWLRSVDTIPHHAHWINNPCEVPPNERNSGLWAIKKTLTREVIDPHDNKTFAKKILALHDKISIKKNTCITLVVCNTVERACATFDAIREMGRTEGLELVHSRFRPLERETWGKRFLSREACTGNEDRIIIATQVIEAGVDISANCLVTELAPWPSLVQRFGRCARYGGSGQVIVVDRRGDKSLSAPYSTEELESAWESIQGMNDVGISALEAFEESLNPDAKARLYPFSPPHLLLRSEFDELFDTTPDLTGADLDISRFIRSGDERDLQVFWIEVPVTESPSSKRQPQRIELCPVPFLKAQDWLCGEETKTNRKPKLRCGMRAWIWDWIEGEWTDAQRANLLPGRIVCVASSCGGYEAKRGFSPNSKDLVAVTSPSESSINTENLNISENQQNGENLSFNAWKTIACHSLEVAEMVQKIGEDLKLTSELKDILVMAGRWHDWGKAHPAFQGAMRNSNRPHRNDLAKGPEGSWLRPAGTYRFFDNSDNRPAFRHELASALGLLALLAAYDPQHPALLGPWRDVFIKMGRIEEGSKLKTQPSTRVKEVLDCSEEKFNLVVYLVASHHGKVRMALHPAPKDQEYQDRDGRGLPIRGLREGDSLPPIGLDFNLTNVPETFLTLSPASIGLSTVTGVSWRERCIGLLERFGPSTLAFLEALLRAADVRASRLKTNDPALPQEANS